MMIKYYVLRLLESVEIQFSLLCSGDEKLKISLNIFSKRTYSLLFIIQRELSLKFVNESSTKLFSFIAFHTLLIVRMLL